MCKECFWRVKGECFLQEGSVFLCNAKIIPELLSQGSHSGASHRFFGFLLLLLCVQGVLLACKGGAFSA